MTGVYHIKGKIFPSDFNLGQPATFRMINSDQSMAYEVSLSIVNSVLKVKAIVSAEDINEKTIINIVKTDVSSLIDFHCMNNVYGYDFVLNAIRGPGERKFREIDVIEPIFADDYLRLEDHQSSLSPIGLIRIDSYLRFSISSYRLAICRPDETLCYAHRAIEGIRDAICFSEIPNYDPEGNARARTHAWKIFREKIGINLSDFSNHNFEFKAKKLRHGQMIYTSWEERRYALRFARNVIMKYVKMRLNER